MLSPKQKDRIGHMLQFMEYDSITDRQHELVEKFEKQFKERGSLSDRQIEILEDIFKQAAESA